MEHYLRSLLEFCFPRVAREIDGSRPFEWLDKELQEVVRDAEAGKLWADKLVKVFCQDSREEWVLIHVEVQSQRDPRLPARMYAYHHRIEARFGEIPYALRGQILAVVGEAELKRLHRQAVLVTDLPTFQHSLANPRPVDHSLAKREARRWKLGRCAQKLED